jgi:thiosulfate dehydrogenase
MRTRHAWIALGGALTLLMVTALGERALAHKEKHTAEQLKAFEDVFMDQVKLGDALFHGDEAAEKQMGTQLSKTGMACAMCHPFASDTHPHEFPKFQEQMNKFATDSDAMKALEAYITWSNKGSKLDAGRH